MQSQSVPSRAAVYPSLTRTVTRLRTELEAVASDSDAAQLYGAFLEAIDKTYPELDPPAVTYGDQAWEQDRKRLHELNEQIAALLDDGRLREATMLNVEARTLTRRVLHLEEEGETD